MEKISNWAFQQKMSFKRDITKEAQGVIFFRNFQKLNHLSLTFKGTSITESEIRKQLGVFLDSKLDFKEHIQNLFN